MQTKLKTTFLKSWMMTVLLSMTMLSCLPVQKKTQCGENEAFNATKRKCVPVIGASTSNTVFIGAKFPANSYSIPKSVTTGSTHTVAVSDVYNYGFTVDWYVHASGSTSTVPQRQDSVTFDFIPSIFGPGTYVVEAILYDQDGVNQLDSTTWNVIVENLVAPVLTSTSPSATAFSYLNTITTTRTHSAVISSPDLEDGRYYIYLDGVLVAPDGFPSPTSVPFNSTTTLASYSFVPGDLTNGSHTLEIKIHDGTTSDPLFDSYVWQINIIDPDYPVIQPIGNSTVPKLTQTITVVDGVTFGAGGWSNPSGINLVTLSPTNRGLCVEFDNVDKLTPMGVADITVVMSVNGIDFEPNAQREGTTNVFCATTTNLNNAQTYFNLSNPDVAEARTITVKTYAVGTTNLIEALSWNVAVRPTNIRPVISIDGANTSSLLGCSATNAVTYTGCTLTQSVNNDRDSDNYDYTGPLDSAAIAASNFAINIDYDPDIQAETDYQVKFQVKPAGSGSWEDIDVLSVGLQTNSPASNYTYSDCTYSPTETSGTLPSSNKLICALRMDAFNNSGPLPSGAYILRAYITDANNGVGSGTPKESNIVSWSINVLENQDTGSITIAPFITAGSSTPQNYFVNGQDQGATTLTQSFANSSSATTTAQAVGTEKFTITINSLVRDTQRDDFTISVSADNGLLGGQTALASTSLKERLDSREWVRVQTTVILPEWMVTGAASQARNFYITVQDRPESYTPVCTTCASDTEILTLTITNTNPPPSFTDPAGAADVDLIGFKAFAGQPFSVPFTTAGFLDTSIFDGNNVTWQWRISLDGGGTFDDIPNANSDNQVTPALTWTPNHDIANAQDVQLQLCLGDDGFGNDVSTCTISKTWTNLTAYQATSKLARSEVNTSSGNEAANWFDSSTKSLYTTYTSGTTIYVEKQKFNDVTQEFENIHSIAFPTEDINASQTPVIAEGLSIDGTDGGALIISYKVTQAGTNSPQFRIRRIDLTNDKLNFNYCGFYTPTDNGSHTGCISSDKVGATAGLLGATISSGSPRQLAITFTGPASGVFELITNSGATVTFNYGGPTVVGTDTVGFCDGGCGSTTATATALADAINNVDGITDADSPEIFDLAQEISATVAGSTVTITGANEFDYYDESSATASYVGNVKIIDGTTWVLPIADGASSLKVKIGSGAGVNNVAGLNSTPLGSTLLLSGTGINNQELVQVELGASLYIGTVNNIGNMSLYKIDRTGYALQGSLMNIFTLSNYDSIESLSIDGQSVGGDKIIASAVSLSSGGERDLAMAIINVTGAPTLTSQLEKVSAGSGLEHYVENLDRVKVVADTSISGSSFVALTTTIGATINPNSAYIVKVNNLNFQDYNYPKLNINDVSPGSAIAVSPIANLTAIGHLAAPVATNILPAPAEDGVLNPLFFTFHEADTGNKVRSGYFHTDTTNITTDSTAVSGSFPGFIGNN